MTKILAIDDKNDNLISLKAILEDIFTDSLVITALSGPKGLELAAKENPDVILLDIVMPEMDGLQATRQIRVFNKDVIIIAQTAYGLEGDRRNAIAAGCNDYIAKPINEKELKKLIFKHLKK